MLLSLLLNLTPTEPTILEGFYGRQVQGWFLKLVAQHDSELAERLHQSNGPRPYTVSGLILRDRELGRIGEDGRIPLVPGNECQLRLTTLSRELSELLLGCMVPSLPQMLRLKWSHFKELRLAEQNQWDGETTFEALIEKGAGTRGESVTLQFASPTAFRSGQVDITLPVPEQVWRSLWWRWNAFAPPELHIDPLWPQFAANCLVVSDYCLRAQKVQFKGGAKGAATGATGQATYRLLPERHSGDFAVFREGADQVLRTLAAFALYAGVGHHTTIGLGQTRWLGIADC